MANGWTPERRAAQSTEIKNWRPWEHSSGPRTADGKARSSRNAWRGGHRRQVRELMKRLGRALRQQEQVRLEC
jgi:hypothetical protein